MEVKLVMFKNDGQRRDFPVTARTTSVGRGEDCGLRVPLLSVSRRHCELSLTDQEIRVRDLGSSNGTYLNNNRISDEEPLKAGDHLAVGPVIFTVQIDGQPEDIQPVKAKDQKAPEEEKQVEVEEVEEVEEGAAATGVDVVATASTDRGEDVEPETVQIEEPPEEQILEVVQEESSLDTIVDSSEEAIDPISALEALADKGTKDKQPKPPS